MSASIAQQLSVSQTAMYFRMGVGLVLGVCVTAGLFWLMQYMIETADRSLNEDAMTNIVDFVRLERDEEVERRQRKPEKPPEPEEPPPEPPAPRMDNLNPSAETIAVSAPPAETDIEMSGGFSLGVGEGDYLPIVKVAPIYPQRALSRGLEGFCVVQYTVTRNGTIKDPFVVEDQCSSSMFHRASVEAALKFKYKPRVIDGSAVEVPGVQNKFTYEITE